MGQRKQARWHCMICDRLIRRGGARVAHAMVHVRKGEARRLPGRRARFEPIGAAEHASEDDVRDVTGLYVRPEMPEEAVPDAHIPERNGPYEQELREARERREVRLLESTARGLLHLAGWGASVKDIGERVSRDCPSLAPARRQKLIETCLTVQARESIRQRRLDPRKTSVVPIDQIIDEDRSSGRPKREGDVPKPKLSQEKRDEGRRLVAGWLRRDPDRVKEDMRRELERALGAEISSGSFYSTYLQPARLMAERERALENEDDCDTQPLRNDEPTEAAPDDVAESNEPATAKQSTATHEEGPCESAHDEPVLENSDQESTTPPEQPEAGETGDASEAVSPPTAEAEPAPARGDLLNVEFSGGSTMRMETMTKRITVDGDGGSFEAWENEDGDWSTEIRVDGLSWPVVSVLLHYMSRHLCRPKPAEEPSDEEDERSVA